MEINKGNCKPFEDGRKGMKLWIINLQIQLKKQNKETNKQNNLLKQTNKQNNLLILTGSCENKSCLIRSKKEKTKP